MIFLILLARLVLSQNLKIPGWNLNIGIKDEPASFDENSSYYGIIKDYESRNETPIDPYHAFGVSHQPNNETTFDFNLYPRWTLDKKYFDLSFEVINRDEARVSDGINSWLHSADELYNYGHRDLVVEAFKKIKVIVQIFASNFSEEIFFVVIPFKVSTSYKYERKEDLEDDHIHLANACELETINALSYGTLFNILYEFWNRNENTLAFWDWNEFAIYELDDSWLDCRRQSLKHEFFEGLRSVMIEKMEFVEGVLLCDVFRKTPVLADVAARFQWDYMRAMIRGMYNLWKDWSNNQPVNEVIEEKTAEGEDILVRRHLKFLP